MAELKKEIYNDVWFFYKKYVNGDNSDAYWEELDNYSKELIKKYNGDLFARSLISAVIDELARMYSNKDKDHQCQN